MDDSTKEKLEMIRSIITLSCSVLLTFLVGGIIWGADDQKKSPKVLEVNKTTNKLEVRVSQIGYRDTLLFYTFKDQNAVLKLQISNKDKSFPMTGTIYIFAADVKEADLKKWLNNQHSDGLFPEVPKPIVTQKLPATTCKITSHKYLDHSKQGFGEYDNYSVTFEVKDYTDKKGIRLKSFAGNTKVHIKTK